MKRVCTMYIVQYTMYNEQCTKYKAQCTMYNVQCTMNEFAMYNKRMYNIQCNNVHFTMHRILTKNTRLRPFCSLHSTFAPMHGPCDMEIRDFNQIYTSATNYIKEQRKTNFVCTNLLSSIVPILSLHRK